MKPADSSSQHNSGEAASGLGPILAMLLLRLWLGLRSLLEGVEKFAGKRTVEEVVMVDGQPNEFGLVDTAAQKVYGLSHFRSVPESMYERLLAEPLMPGFALAIYDKILGPLLILLGITVLFGIALRFSLFAMGLLYTSLTFGLILLGQDAGVAWLGIHIILIAMALFHVRHNRCGILKCL